MLKYLALILTAAGLAVALWFIGRTGFAEVLQGVASIGPAGFAVMMGFTAACLLLLGGAWLSVAPGVPRDKLGTFAWARTAREGATDVLPFSQFGGLIIGARAAIVGGIRPTLVYASLIADQTAELAAQLVFTLFGVAMLATALASGGHGPSLLPMVLGGTAVLAAIMTGFAVGQRPLIGMAQGLAARLLPGSIATMAALPQELDAIYARQGRVILSFLLHLAAWVLSAVGAWVALGIMGHHLPVASVLTIEALIFTLRTVAFAIPGGVGVQEAAYALLGPIFGLSPAAGLALSLVKRARDIAIGLPVVLAWQVQEARALRRAA